jgi:alpha-amylase
MRPVLTRYKCWEGDNVVSLPDIRTEDSIVQSMWAKWVKELVANYTSNTFTLTATIKLTCSS